MLIDVQLASAIAHSVVVRDREPERWAWFQRLVEAELAHAIFQGLGLGREDEPEEPDAEDDASPVADAPEAVAT